MEEYYNSSPSSAASSSAEKRRITTKNNDRDLQNIVDMYSESYAPSPLPNSPGNHHQRESRASNISDFTVSTIETSTAHSEVPSIAGLYASAPSTAASTLAPSDTTSETVSKRKMSPAVRGLRWNRKGPGSGLSPITSGPTRIYEHSSAASSPIYSAASSNNDNTNINTTNIGKSSSNAPPPKSPKLRSVAVAGGAVRGKLDLGSPFSPSNKSATRASGSSRRKKIIFLVVFLFIALLVFLLLFFLLPRKVALEITNISSPESTRDLSIKNNGVGNALLTMKYPLSAQIINNNYRSVSLKGIEISAFWITAKKLKVPFASSPIFHAMLSSQETRTANLTMMSSYSGNYNTDPLYADFITKCSGPSTGKIQIEYYFQAINADSNVTYSTNVTQTTQCPLTPQQIQGFLASLQAGNQQ